ncbi:MAG: hypothetical protein KatS3mg011_1063 [Acidimicrobiia bacterium]|nr:MAG: hypothetical protein KatS3mg011_1063 [Acidimicrobiia bacterium]
MLTLVGNDVTIDARARKTAAGLARAGFSVVSLGVDPVGAAPQSESLDGARIHRIVPTLDPRVSTRIFRFSRPELRDWLRYGTEIQRVRLQMARRELTAWRRWQLDELADLLRSIRPDHTDSERREPSWGRRAAYRLHWSLFQSRLRLRRARLIASQLRYVALDSAYKAFAKPPRAWKRPGSWRRDLPELHRYEAAIGPLVDLLQPDLIHVHDVFHLGLAARAKARAAERGRRMPVVYDAHEFVAGLPIDPRRRAAFAQLEDEYIRRVDAVVTVSPALAGLLENRYGLSAEVVMNTPDTDDLPEVDSIRSTLGLPENRRLVVYVGGIAPHRGVEELIEALTLLDDHVHLALVTNSTTGYVDNLRQRAHDLGVEDRLHLAPYVMPEAVVSYLRGSDVSVIPLRRGVPNYDVALPNKLFQSIHARVPVVVSDSPEMARFVQQHRVGEIFLGGDPVDLASKVRKILENPDNYVSAIHPMLLETLSWRSQFDRLLQVYAELGISIR